MKTKLLQVFALVFVSVLGIYIESTRLWFGKFINLIVPCKEEPMTSFPCYGAYDAVLMLVLISIIISIIPISVLRFLKHRTVK